MPPEPPALPSRGIWKRIRSFIPSLFSFTFLFLFVAIASAVGLVGILLILASSGALSGTPLGGEQSIRDGSGGNCNVTGLEIRGCITTYRPENNTGEVSDTFGQCDTITSSEEIVWALEDAAKDDSIKAVVLEIDSSGGVPVAAEEIAAALKKLGKPSIAWVRSAADSAAYWIASAADTIIAGETSDIGSIGATYSYVDYAKQNQQQGITYNQLTTGKYKDTGTPERALTADDRALIERDLKIINKEFIATVAANRKLPIDTVTALADGSTMLGAMALQNGLIDTIGTKGDVWNTLDDVVGEKAEVCWPSS